MQVYFETCTFEYQGENPHTGQPVVDRKNVRTVYGNVVSTVSQEMFDITAAGSKRSVACFVIALPDGTFTVQPVEQCKHCEPIYKQD